MAEKKKGKKRKEEYIPPGEEIAEKPSKEEYTIAKWMRKNVPIKKTKFLNHNVKYFTASRAIDALLGISKWSSQSTANSSSPSASCLFHTRDNVVDYLHRMLEHKFFHRARKVPVSELELLGKSGGGGDKKKTKEEAKRDGEKDSGKEGGGKGTDAESSVVEGVASKEVVVEKEKRKRKIRLDMHNDQRFVDSLDAYVWIYDPIPLHYWLMGAAFVLGAIGLCLFPLWPPSVRLAVYYLSVAAAVFLVFIILLVVVRLIVFCLVWTISFGTHHLWILPNLTEDVGFFASFWPLYKYEFKGAPTNGKKSKKRKKDKDSDGEDNDKDDDTAKLLDGDGDSKHDDEQRNSGDIQPCDPSTVAATVAVAPQSATLPEGVAPGNNSESESESSQRSSTGKDFEMVEEGDLDEGDEEEEEDEDGEVEDEQKAHS